MTRFAGIGFAGTRFTGNRLNATVTRWLGHIVVALLVAMVLNVLWQIASRYLLGQPSAFTEEIARFLLIWLGLLGAAYASSFGDHIALDLLPMPQAWRDRIQRLAMAALGLLLTSGGVWLVRFTAELEQRSAALNLPLAWVYLAAPLAGALILFFTLIPRAQDP